MALTHYTIILSYSTSYRYSIGLGAGRAEYYMLLNNLRFYEVLTKIQQQLLTLQQDSDMTIKNDLVFVMVLIITISAICLSIVLPLYVYVQRAKETVLRLLATFSYAALS